MNSHTTSDTLQAAAAPYRTALAAHPLYTAVHHPAALHTLMEHHVFAVWDFMSLLKSLQQQLTCVSVPWVPRGHADTRYLINEIVCGEESDVDEMGQRSSHFEIYLSAMQQAGASTEAIERFIDRIKHGHDVDVALGASGAPAAAAAFVRKTFEFIKVGKPHVLAAVFTFGREDIIPQMFTSFVKEIGLQHQVKVGKLLYYLERHIEVDGDHHSHLALQMTDLLIQNEKDLNECAAAIQLAMDARLALWDGVMEQINMPSLSL